MFLRGCRTQDPSEERQDTNRLDIKKKKVVFLSVCVTSLCLMEERQSRIRTNTDKGVSVEVVTHPGNLQVEGFSY